YWGMLGCQQSVQVETNYGVVEGKLQGSVAKFLGIPYALPPIGDLRWHDPQPPQPWQGVFSAHHYGAACTQFAVGLPVFEMSEDCLTLNIWVPNALDTTTPSNLPVMFWVHGGGQMAGSSSELQYDAAEFAASQNVIVVSANYRLLISGFFAVSSDGNDNEVSGNQSIKDLLLALQWVHNNIANFGGDPGNVTVFGESAGSTNTCALLATPKTRSPEKLMQRVIMQSGACDTLGVMSLAEAQSEGEKLLEELGCADAADPLECARAIPMKAIRAMKKVNLLESFTWRLDEWPFRIGLVIDGDLFPRDPLELLSDEVVSTPVLLGSNKDEGSLFTGFLDHPAPENYLSFMESRYPGKGDDIAARYPVGEYINTGSAHAAARGDLIFKCPTLNMAQLLSDKNPVYLYSFEHDVKSPLFSLVALLFGSNAPDLGTFHGSDMGYLFGFPILTSFHRDSDLAIKSFMQNAWGRFATVGSPNGDTLPTWEPFDVSANNYIRINSDPAMLTNFNEGRCDYWFEVGYGF
ncbi:MAG: carboxylesterase family protein, partial [Pseudomonadales bacterium]|nr:carboxylesterase family protein [Pseudomonadales bacterium]